MATLAAAEHCRTRLAFHKHYLPLGERRTARAHTAAVELLSTSCTIGGERHTAREHTAALEQLRHHRTQPTEQTGASTCTHTSGAVQNAHTAPPPTAPVTLNEPTMHPSTTTAIVAKHTHICTHPHG